MEKRYGALRTIATIFKIIGGIFGVLTIFLVLIICASAVLEGAAIQSFSQDFGTDWGLGIFGGILGGIIGSLFAIFSVGVPALVFYGLGESIYLFLGIEENTRATAQMMQSQMRQNQRPTPTPPASPTS